MEWCGYPREMGNEGADRTGVVIVIVPSINIAPTSCGHFQNRAYDAVHISTPIHTLDVCGIRGQEKDGGVFRCSVAARYVGIRKCGLVGTIPDMEIIR